LRGRSVGENCAHRPLEIATDFAAAPSMQRQGDVPMKPIVLLLAMFGQFYPTPPSDPATAPNPDYPVHVHILIARASGGSGDYHGFGRGDILGPTLQGFDYTFSCGQPFNNNRQPEEFYQARWKKPNEKLEILLQPVGSSHTNRCELNIALKAKPYGRYTNPQTPAQPTAPTP